MSIKEITIDERQTNEKEDIVYAVIDMEDNYMHRTAYYTFFIIIMIQAVGYWIIGETTKQDVINYYEEFGMNVQYY